MFELPPGALAPMSSARQTATIAINGGAANAPAACCWRAASTAKALYIDPVARLVTAKFSSQPQARDTETFNLQFALFEAIAAYFDR